MKKSLLFLLISLYFCSITNAQEEINLWGNVIPGAKMDSSYDEIITVGSDNSNRIQQVITPTLTVFMPEVMKENQPAIIVCPGGGYQRLAIQHEGYDVAKWMAQHGFVAFVLKYRLPSDKIMEDKTVGPLQDAQEAMRYVRRNCKIWNINPDKIGIIGFSAGGHLASTLSTHYNDVVYAADSTSAKPSFSVLIYPVISMDTTLTHKGSRNYLLGEKPSTELVTKFSNQLQVNSNTPPTFLVAAADDYAVNYMNSLEYFNALVKCKVPAEMHLFEKGGHGFGLGVKKGPGTQSQWPILLMEWLKTNRGIVE